MITMMMLMTDDVDGYDNVDNNLYDYDYDDDNNLKNISNNKWQNNK